MMKGIFILIAFLSLTNFTTAQEKIRVKAGEDFSKALNSYGIYRFPEFTNAKISFRNGNQSVAMLNYNLVLSEVQFLNPPKDTLSIGNPEEISLMEIDSILFYYDKRYLEVIGGSTAQIKLAQWQQIKIEFEQLGAFDQPSNGVDVKNYKNVKSSMGYNVNEYTANQNRIITRDIKYFLVDKFGKSFPANKAGFYNLFPGNKAKIQEYQKANNLHFENPADIKALYKFCMETSL